MPQPPDKSVPDIFLLFPDHCETPHNVLPESRDNLPFPANPPLFTSFPPSGRKKMAPPERSAGLSPAGRIIVNQKICQLDDL
jgi:hypothetical protein